MLAPFSTVQGTTQTEELEDFFGLRGIQNGKGGILFECSLDNILGKVNPIPAGVDYDDVVVELEANGQTKRAWVATL